MWKDLYHLWSSLYPFMCWFAGSRREEDEWSAVLTTENKVAKCLIFYEIALR